MSSLSEVKIIYGYCIKNDNNLSSNIHYNSMCFCGSLYQQNNQIILDSAQFRGVDEYQLIHSPITTELNFEKGNFRSGNYIWLGHIPDHFGHFILSLISRLWAVYSYPNHFRLAYCGKNFDEILKTRYICDLFEVFGLNINRMIKINDGDILEYTYVPQQCFIENYCSNKIIGQLYDKFSKYNKISCENDFVYISRRNITSGTFGVENEKDLEFFLMRKGIKIINIEELSIKDQINEWGKYNNFIGFSGSSFHLGSLLNNKTFIIINRNEFLSSNQYIIDQFSKNKCYHLYSNNIVLKNNDKFNLYFEIKDVEKMANDISGVIEKIKNSKINPTTVNRLHKSASKFLIKNDSIGEKISHYAIATQSSIYGIDEGNTRNAQGVLSGYLTGIYQFHTELEENPWIKLDLTKRSLINEIRIFNRNDRRETYNRFHEYEILTSEDDIEYNKIFSSFNEKITQNIINGEKFPIRVLFSNDIFSRYIKIVSIGYKYLHLDQIEVFGFWCDPEGTKNP
ncbi:DUF563 domain-containing protein [Gluconobacter kondonii]|uniref:discoidin domain-containing protein n=1 Tax=Gluconobacter kondonii TaxID=941463 RepID=UPI001B8B93F7|nr:discoidin domain-containing protein [Gluconobacter kondonii]MBS1078950.1 DUF563 domain-containing protein [Gluconobacter kondonii]